MFQAQNELLFCKWDRQTLLTATIHSSDVPVDTGVHGHRCSPPRLEHRAHLPSSQEKKPRPTAPRGLPRPHARKRRCWCPGARLRAPPVQSSNQKSVQKSQRLTTSAFALSTKQARTQRLQQLPQGLQPQVVQLLLRAPERHLRPPPAVPPGPPHSVHCMENTRVSPAPCQLP